MDFARRLGVRNYRQVWKYANPSLAIDVPVEVMERICAVLGWTPLDFFERGPAKRSQGRPSPTECDFHASRPWDEPYLISGDYCPGCRADAALYRGAVQGQRQTAKR
jgi:hypothetical protein